jgi:hypothetical protein
MVCFRWFPLTNRANAQGVMTEGKVLVSMCYQPAEIVFDTAGIATAAISATVGTGALVGGGGEARNRSISTASQASVGAGEKAKFVENTLQSTAPPSTPEKVRQITVGTPGSTPGSANSSASKVATHSERLSSPVSTSAAALTTSASSRFRTDSAAERPHLSEQTARSRSASTISQPGIAPSPSAASATEHWVSAEEPERTSTKDSNTDKASSEAAVLTQLATAGAVAGVAVPVPVTSFYRTLSEFTERTTSTIGTLRCCNLNL